MIRRVCVFMKALGAFLTTLVGAQDQVVAVSQNGHSKLKGWDRCLDEEIAQKVSKGKETKEPFLGLFCYEGPHEGNLLMLAEGRESLGADSANSVVITPRTGFKQATFQLQSDRIAGSKLVAKSLEPSGMFRVNGREESQCVLFDYDEIEVLGNRFLVLDLNLRGVTQ
jgi:hypothetical protein